MKREPLDQPEGLAPGAEPESPSEPSEPSEQLEQLEHAEQAEQPGGRRPELGPAELEEHGWVRAAQRGDELAFERLVRTHQARAWRVARNLVPNDEDARDLVQEAFVRVFKHIARFDFQYAFSTWLYRIVTNLGIDHLRKRRPTFSTTSTDEERGSFDLPDEDATMPGAHLESLETADEVRATLETLAPHFQSALVLRELEGLACTEIARIVGATHVTVRWRLHRGRKLFQEEWERRARMREARGPLSERVERGRED